MSLCVWTSLEGLPSIFGGVGAIAGQGGLCLHTPDMPVLGANSAKAIAWGRVGLLRAGIAPMLPETGYCPRDAMENALLDPALSSQCFAHCQETTAYTGTARNIFKAIWVHGGIPSVFAAVCSLGDSWLATCTKTSLSLSKAYLPVKALLNILKIAKCFW